MNVEYAYPDVFGWVSTVSWSVMILVAILFFVPIVREAVRRGPMNGVDLVIGVLCLSLCLGVPFLDNLVRSTISWSGANPDVVASGRIMELESWRRAQFGAFLCASIQIAWLLSYGVKKFKGLRIFLVYAIPVFWLCMPTLGAPRWIHDRVNCRNNLKHIGLGLHNYHDSYATFPPSVMMTNDVPRSWRVDLLPYLDQAPLRNSYDANVEWNIAPNAVFAEKRIETFFCGANYRPLDAQKRYYTAYAGVVGLQTFFAEDGSARTIKEMTDGTSNTIAIVEACGAQIVWSEPRDLLRDEITMGVNEPGPKPGTSRSLVSSCHPGGWGHMLMSDGSLRFVSKVTDPALLSALLTVDGGETIPPDAR